ncbi:DUF4418 family protein [Butyrivibrio sp. AE3004]|uniref:DUF4418 family protein n=1 Tax=Butyrivibrio sp. AE3004 TaxID=1506994 RepID=UPI00068A4591|nr:DUF4418 family protein [Butyrivibrio sp. AE3004]
MKNRIISGITFIILGLLIAVGPQSIFAVCGPMEDGKFMKCHWTAQAELGIGLAIVFLAAGILFFKSEQIRAGLSIAAFALSIVSVLVPTKLIGVCGGEHMQCHSLTKPVLIILGIAGAVFALANTFFLLKNKEKVQVVQELRKGA